MDAALFFFTILSVSIASHEYMHQFKVVFIPFGMNSSIIIKLSNFAGFIL